MTYSELIFHLKKNTVMYYIASFWRQLSPNVFLRCDLNRILRQIKNYDRDEITRRVDYYNRLNRYTSPGDAPQTIADLIRDPSPKAYRFDTYEYLRYFDPQCKINFLFGDIRHVPSVPSVQKSRPIQQENANAVLLKLDKKRHFLFLKDRKPFRLKKNMLYWRGTVTQAHRKEFMDMHFDSPYCDIGQINKNGGDMKWFKSKISVPAHFDYKFILSIEGNDVATNLKWIMASNSVAVMPRPKFETWFMEGTLIGGEHYIEIKDDYTDLENRLRYYIEHPEEAEQISRNANAYVQEFRNRKKERLISLLVLRKYFRYTVPEQKSSRRF